MNSKEFKILFAELEYVIELLTAIKADVDELKKSKEE